MNIDLAIADTLKSWRQIPFKWGETDCMQSIAEYTRILTGADSTRGLRGTYTTEEEASALLRAAGGEQAMLAWSGLSRVEAYRPVKGDVVLAWFGQVKIPGICTGDGIAFRMERGVTELHVKLVTINTIWRML